MKHILITGKNSYIGQKLISWLDQAEEDYFINELDMHGEAWKDYDFSTYDVIFHVAGIAHVSTDPKLEELYYKVNRDLTIENAKKAKFDGVKQFIFMSSIIVYGDSSGEGIIDKDTVPAPSDFYGTSKLQAEEGIKHLQSKDFQVAILRPPMIYGKRSKGNYPRLSNLAKKTPMFPDIDNKRSMLHIDNLCEFIKAMIDYEESGIFFPQNKEYVKTSVLVETIAEIHGRKILTTRFFNPIIKLMLKINTMNKIFGNLYYQKLLSNYDKVNYRVRDFKESIELTESKVEK